MLRGIVQHDTLNVVNIRLSDGSKAFDYYGYTNIVLKVLKADGTSYIDSEGENVVATSPEDGIVTVILGGQATAAAGLNQAVIEIYADGDRMTSARLIYEVFEELPVDETALVSEVDYPVLQNLMRSMENGYVTRAEQAADEAERSAAIAEDWARQARDIAGGDFATRTELNALKNTKPVSDWNDARSNGWYSGAAGTANSPDPTFTWFGRVSSFSNDIRIQEVWGLINTTVYRHCVRLVYPNGGTPWEWENPPLINNVEYRTTERHIGKNVYAKSLSYGELPTDGTALKLPIATGEALSHVWVDHIVCANSNGINKFPTGEGVPSVEITSDNYDQTNVYVKITNSGKLSGYSGVVVVKYIKTTDT